MCHNVLWVQTGWVGVYTQRFGFGQTPRMLTATARVRPCQNVLCEGCDIVQSDHAPQAGVAQGIFDGELVRRRVGHQVELEEEQDEEVERRVRRDAQRTRHKCACMDDME